MALDRRERRIQWYMLGALVVGAVLGFAGGGLAELVPGWMVAVYDPFVFSTLSIVVGANAASLGWATANGALAAFGALLGQIAASVVVYDASPFDDLAGSASALNLLVLLLFVLGPTSYLATLPGRVGVAATGLTAGIVLSDGAEELARAAKGAPYPNWGLAMAMSVVLSVVLVFVFRRRARARLIAAAIALVFAVVYGLLVYAL